MEKCRNCKHLFRDWSVGYSECTHTDDMTDAQYAEYEEFGFVSNCPFFEADEDESEVKYIDALMA